MVRLPTGGTAAGRKVGQKIKTADKKTLSSQAWIKRQLSDEWSDRARAEGWRSRAAFKLMEIDDRFRLIRKGARVIDLGGVQIGDTTYDVQIVAFDDQKDPKRAIAGMEKMAQDGVHYVVGPNVDDGAAAVRPVAEQKGIIYFPYAFPKTLYVAPASNAILGMVANYQSGPAIYKYLMENKGVKKVAFVAANESDPLSQRDSGIEAAKALG